MSASTHRRTFLKSSAVLLGSCALAACQKKDYPEDLAAPARFKISLAQWSLHRALRAGEVDNIDFARIARENFGLDAVEWSGQFLSVDHPRLGAQPKSKEYFAEIKQATTDLGVANLLIMCDKVGSLGDPDEKRRNNSDRRTLCVGGIRQVTRFSFDSSQRGLRRVTPGGRAKGAVH